MKEYKIREPAVAGQFYPSSSQGLRSQIQSFIDIRAEKKDAIACMLPHAGYIYSGKVAGLTVSGINVKSKIILLGPNHTGFGPVFSIMTEGIWQMPLGQIKIDSDLAKRLLKTSEYLEQDYLAHMHEHCLEVELPFLQFFRQDFEIVPIVVASDDASALKNAAKEIALAVKELDDPGSVLIVASSDMTHNESDEQARKKDKYAIDAILELDIDKLTKRVREQSISMCGYAPVVIMLGVSKILGASSAKLIKYQTSSDVTGDTAQAVGYAGIAVY